MEKKHVVIIVRMDPPPGKEKEWNKWYNEDHIPSRLALPGYLAIRRFELTSGLPGKFVAPDPKYMTVVELESLDAMNSKERQALDKKEATQSPTSFEVISKSLPNHYGSIYEQIYPEQQTYTIPENANYLLVEAHDALPHEVVDEYNAWFNTEHIFSYTQIPGFINARRFMIIRGKQGCPPNVQTPGPQFTALYDLANDNVFETVEFKASNNTPWSTRVRQLTWNHCKMNNMYKCIYTEKQ